MEEPTTNPYAPPATEVNAAPVETEDAFPNPLFSPRQMLAASIFGSLLAGVILLQANYRAMSQRRQANRSLLVGSLASAAFFALMFFLPAKIPPTPINVAAALALYKLADTLQGAAFLRHRAAKGERQSNWLVFGITVGTAVAVLVALFLIVLRTGVPDIDTR